MPLGSKVEIYNSALAKLGVEGVTSPTDDSTRARLCNQLYDILRRDVLRSHPWNFAKKQVALTAVSTGPVYGYANSYQLPTDYIRGLDVEDNFIPWKIYGDKLYTDASSVNLSYVWDCDTVGYFDANFAETLAYRMAMDMAEALTGSTNKAADMEKKYRFQLSQARSFNAQEGSSDQVSADTWLDSRF